MIRSKRSQHSRSRNRKMGQSPTSKPIHPEHGLLQSLVLKDGDLQIIISNNDLPPFLARANTAIKTGRVDEAIGFLNDEAVEVVQKMVEKDPARTDVMFILAMLFSKTNQTDRAEQWYKRILKQEPHALVLSELGRICVKTGRFWEATQYRRKALQADPDNSELASYLATDLIRIGQTQEGISLLRKAIEKAPNHAALHSKLLFCLHHLPEPDPQMLFNEHKRWGQIHAPPSKARVSHNNTAEPDRRLRIGYISPDFCMHSVARFFEPLLDEHNHKVVEVYGYGNVGKPDESTERLKCKFDYYQNIHGMSDEAVAGMIEQDKIDILVDLAGQTVDNRLLVLAYKPAPIQVTYLGYPDTTGMQAIDYRLTGALADPPESQKFYTEELVFLPEGFLCYRPPDVAPPVAPLPAIKKGYITFGSFNNNRKLNPLIIAFWAEVLKANSSSRLLLKFNGGDDQGLKNHYFSQFEQLGIPREKVEICGWKPHLEHLQLYEEVDIALDTYPYNGTTTICEALWMGVPTISLVGRCHASRVGLSILSRVGLDIFTASTPAEYVAKAAAFAGELENLAKIRASMRRWIAASALCNAKAFAHSVEKAYQKMWHRWCQDRGADTPSEELLLSTK